MGYELIPFSSRQQAEEFKGRNGGKRIIKLGEVRPHDVDRKKK